jgi:hypothetical protein
MTTVAPAAASDLLSLMGLDAVTSTAGVVVLLLVAGLLLAREIARARDPRELVRVARTIDILMAPLLGAFLIIVTSRLLNLVLP